MLYKEKKRLGVENAATLKEFNQYQQEMIDMEEELESVGTRRPAMTNLFERNRQSPKGGRSQYPWITT